jgi:hypothetical protein
MLKGYIFWATFAGCSSINCKIFYTQTSGYADSPIETIFGTKNMEKCRIAVAFWAIWLICVRYKSLLALLISSMLPLTLNN